MAAPPWDAWEAILRRDPGDRGVATYRTPDWPLGLGYGDLAMAAASLARGRRVAIVTGFCIVGATPPAAETDGPPGALYLADALSRLGMGVTLMSDRYGLPLLTAGAESWELGRRGCELLKMPIDRSAAAAWVDDFLAREVDRGLTHLVSIERCGPSHTKNTAGLADFAAQTPPEHWDVCHNMLGANIDAYTAPAHLLFDAIVERKLPVATIGIGDGGNEIGMGRFSWQTLRAAIRQGPAAQTACRIATDQTIVAGVSDWGGYALALATAALANKRAAVQDANCERQTALIRTLVAAGAVDGVTRQRSESIDGLPLDAYLAPLGELRRSLGMMH